MNTKPIQEFILLSEGNFHIAAAVAEAWPEAKTQLMSSFLDSLEILLMGKLKGWKPRRDSNFFKATAGYYITKPKWAGSYEIGFECKPGGSRVYIGIRWKTDKTRKQAPDELLIATQKIYPSAEIWSDPRWSWVYATLRSPSPDWSKPDVLWQMKEPKFVTDLGDQLLEIVKVSEHIIDRLVRKSDPPLGQMTSGHAGPDMMTSS